MQYIATDLHRNQTIDNLVKNFMLDNNLPGLSLAIVQAPYIPRVVGYGLANIDSKRLVATNTLFNIGQMTNGFTAVAIMQLIEAGKLNLDDSIHQFVTALPTDWHTITIRELISHSSGIPHEINNNNNDSITQLFDAVKNKKLLFQPGTNVSYSPINYYLLTLLITNISGLSYEEYITKYQIEALGLKYTYFISDLNSINNEVNDAKPSFSHSKFKNDVNYINPIEAATGYSEITGKLNPVNLMAATEIMSTAQDISFWDIALAGDILIKNKKYRDFIYQSVTLKNGTVIPANAGWLFPGHKGFMYIEGNVPGYTSYLARFTDPSELVCVTLLVNKEHVLNLEILGREIAACYNSKLATPASSPWTVVRQSPYSVKETLDRLAAIIQQQGGKIFVRIDHQENAVNAGEKMHPMEVLIFGNPSKGTDLLNAQNAIGIELPLRAMAWQDTNEEVWLSFINPIQLASFYEVNGQDKLLKQMYLALSKAMKKATSAY